VEGNGAVINLSNWYTFYFAKDNSTGSRVNIENVTFAASNTTYYDAALVYVGGSIWQSYFEGVTVDGKGMRKQGFLTDQMWGSYMKNCNFKNCKVGLQVGTIGSADKTHNSYHGCTWTANSVAGVILVNAVTGGIYGSYINGNPGIGLGIYSTNGHESRSFGLLATQVKDNCSGGAYNGVYPGVLIGKSIPNTEFTGGVEVASRHIELSSNTMTSAYQKGSLGFNLFYGFECYSNTTSQKSTSYYDIYYYGTKSGRTTWGNSNPNTTFKTLDQ
jgi:hypothetical protein